ncbi:hypothetical protein ACFVYR_20785 [Streptomyces sp. NPDC058284]|uniref:hypothetical protein n=1 Tax=unclassified Streptomyces TaxID=2593676 RepID=UPI00366A4CEB
MNRTAPPDPAPARAARDTDRDLPLDQLAFRQMHRTAYLRYTEARTGNRAMAVQVVEAAFAELAVRWAEMLRHPCPAALAWHVLCQALDVRTGRCPRRPDDTDHRCLQQRQDDAVLLHRHLQLPISTAADLMGLDTQLVRALLRQAASPRP